MNRSPALAILLALLITGVTFAGCMTNAPLPAPVAPSPSGPVPAPEPGANPGAPVSILFVQEAPSGSLVPAGNGVCTLTLSGVVPYTTYFSDRPERIAGFYPLQDFLAGFNWSAAPGAAISRPDAKESEDTLIVTLSDPRYNRTANELVYTVKIIADYKGAGLKELAAKADPKLPENLGRVSLFIDSGSRPGSDATSCTEGRSCLDTCEIKGGKGACYLICGPFCPAPSG